MVGIGAPEGRAGILSDPMGRRDSAGAEVNPYGYYSWFLSSGVHIPRLCAVCDKCWQGRAS